MRKVNYNTTIDGNITANFNRNLKDKKQALLQANILQSNYKNVVKVFEVTTDGEDIISNKLIFDGSDD